MNQFPVPAVAQRRSWPTLKTFWKDADAYQATYLKSQDELLWVYAHTGSIVYTSLITTQQEVVEQPSRSSHLLAPLSIAGINRLISGCREAPSAHAQVLLQNFVLYRELFALLRYLIEEEFPAKFGRKRRGIDMRTLAEALGVSAAVGTLDVMDNIGRLSVEAMSQGYVADDKYRGMLHFMVRLWCAARGVDYPDTGYPRYELAEGVLAMWDTSEVDTLAAWLVQLCNQHTVLTGSRDFMDFANNLSHFPAEILLLFRLREQKGLSNPSVDHAIMQFPWSRLWPVEPAQPDDLLQAVYRRLEQDEGVTVPGLWRQFLG